MNEAMYDPVYWPAFATALAQAEAGDGTVMRKLSGAALNDRVSLTINRFMANNAVDQDYPDDLETLALHARNLDALTPDFAADGIHLLFLGGLWPARSRDVFDGDFHHDDGGPPIVVIGGPTTRPRRTCGPSGWPWTSATPA